MIDIPKPVGLKPEYDVVVIGAGPSGTRCARIIAEAGFSVAVFEKRQEIGAPKRCAEGIGIGALQRMGYTGKERFVTQYIDGALLYAPNGKEFKVEYDDYAGCVVERKVFDKFLAYDAAKAGARIFVKTEVTDLLKDDGKPAGVIVDYGGEKHEVRARIIISAEGIEGKIARKAGIDTTNKPINVDSGYQYEIANINLKDPHKLYFYIGNKIAPRGYIWIFPKGMHVANVGIGIIGSSDKTAKQYLDEWIESRPDLFENAAIIEENAGGIPVGGLLEDMTTDNFMVIGDAAHTVNPLHGGGMDEGTKAGEMAAQVVVEALKVNDTSHEFLAKFNKLWWEERGNKLKKVEKFRQVFEKMSDDDLNFLAEHLTMEDVIEFVGGRGMKKFAKLLMKRPQLIKLASLLK